jgi:hypothetical protein
MTYEKIKNLTIENFKRSCRVGKRRLSKWFNKEKKGTNQDKNGSTFQI